MSLRSAIPVLALAACLAASLGAAPASADVYQWTDDAGVVHFTDEPGNIPAARRGGSKIFLKEKKSPPGHGTRGAAPASEPGHPPPPDAGRPADSPPSPPPAEQDPSDEAETLRARIAAKESFIRQIDEKRSLATNPLRNRIVSPADMDLYDKYQRELPEDRATLESLQQDLRGVR